MKEPKLRFKADDGSEFPRWKDNKFKNVFEPLNNNTFSRALLNGESGKALNIHYGDVLIKYGSYVDVKKDDIPFISDGVKTDRFDRLKNGDVVIADTAEDETVGKTVEIENAENVDVISGLHTMAFRPKITFASKYLGYYLNSHDYHDQLYPLMQGIKVTSIGKQAISETTIHYPSLPEQKKIADFLSAVDARISEQEAYVADLQERKKGFLQQIFSRKLRFKADDGSKFPEWEEKKFNDTVEIERGGSPRPIDSYITDADDGLNWIKIGDAPSFGTVITRTAQKIKKEGLKKTRQVHVGDLILSNSMSFGKPYIMGIDGCIHDGWLLIRNNRNLYDLNFLCDLLGSNYMLNQYRRAAAGSTVNNLNKDLVGGTIVYVPSLPEQKKIADFFSELDEQIANEQAILDDWKLLKKGLLQQMFV